MHQMPDETQFMQGSIPSMSTINVVVSRKKKDELILAFQSQKTISILGADYKIINLDYEALFGFRKGFRVCLELSKV